MDTALYVSLAHRSALKRKMDVVAHNIANMNTTAFKKEQVLFKEYLMDAPGTITGKVASVIDYGVSRTMTEGNLVNTGNNFDIFISGKAFLSVEGKNGDTQYTRNGRLSLDNERYITLLSGERVLDDSGSPIQLEEEERDIIIAKDGTLSVTNVDGQAEEKGKLGFKIFENLGAMKRLGTSLYRTNEIGADPEPDELRVTQKAIESSNVNAIEEITKMIDIQRAYERSGKNTNSYEDMRKDSLNRLAKVSG
ncbi:flagellar hook basal-body protein [Temperatibacter marinus]|uniref:Flagellar hook basal-body protein n=1 Tax=Temperatibacter marinus TaxID=1456591 RepID=A0AA52EG32_9PROT|nr:flagellar hook basal-body protein [Temperatibacter marinus]WND01679.1 flagellar hook basal-body protein [Temperatibacter marinus]